MTALLPEWATMEGSDPQLLRAELLDIIAHAIEGHPRSQQVAIGPSEIGDTCARRIGYKLLGFPEKRREPAWKPTIGTAVHTWLEEQVNAHDSRHYGPELKRWHTEETLYCGTVGNQPLIGHADLFDAVTGTSIDWKIVGPTQLKKYKAKGPGPEYRAQGHIYGRGWSMRGVKVNHVAVMFLPRDGELRDAHYWTESYNEKVALDAIARVEGIAATTKVLGNQAIGLLPAADAYCSFCPFFKAGSTDLEAGCPGAPGTTQRGFPATPSDPSNPFG